MRAVHLVYIMIILSYVSGCSEDSLLSPSVDQVVIEGYLYAGEPVDDIRLTKTLPLGSEDIAPPVNNATVYLLKNSIRYDLSSVSGGEGYYQYTENDLTVDAGDEFELFVEYGGNVASGKTVVPPAPGNILLSSNVISVPTEFYPGETNIENENYRIDISWEENTSALFFVAVENLEYDPDPIEFSFGKFDTGESGRRFLSAPRNTNEFSITFRNLNFYGEHRIRVYRVNQEYADLYTS
ncbi:MAG: DUF4249 family protein, partial [Candidatus Latescibacteria bacterium]|nr:DUF4249 family protein [Candidatus Latescibacterota bacterium]